MKRWLLISLAAVLILVSGCSFKVKRDTFYLPQEEVESVEIQREYYNEDGKSSYYRRKAVTEPADIESVCEKIRNLPVRIASVSEPHPISEFSMIIIIDGKREHHLILNEDIAFYDQIAYEYKKNGVYQSFLDLYDALDYTEEDTEPDRF